MGTLYYQAMAIEEVFKVKRQTLLLWRDRARAINLAMVRTETGHLPDYNRRNLFRQICLVIKRIIARLNRSLIEMQMAHRHKHYALMKLRSEVERLDREIDAKEAEMDGAWADWKDAIATFDSVIWP